MDTRVAFARVLESDQACVATLTYSELDLRQPDSIKDLDLRNCPKSFHCLNSVVRMTKKSLRRRSLSTHSASSQEERFLVVYLQDSSFYLSEALLFSGQSCLDRRWAPTWNANKVGASRITRTCRSWGVFRNGLIGMRDQQDCYQKSLMFTIASGRRLLMPSFCVLVNQQACDFSRLVRAPIQLLQEVLQLLCRRLIDFHLFCWCSEAIFDDFLDIGIATNLLDCVFRKSGNDVRLCNVNPFPVVVCGWIQV